MTAISFTPIGTIHIPYATQEGMPIQAVAYALAEIIPHQRSNSERMALDHYAASATAELRNNHRNGKMLIAKTGQESYDSGWLAQNEYASGGTLYNLLDPRVVAQNPSELGTLVCLAKEEKREGHYADGSGAYQLWYHVWLVDFQTKQVIARSHFQGGLPPGTKRGVGGRTGEPPLLELADWLTRLQNGSP